MEARAIRVTESNVLKAIADYLRFHGFSVFRRNVGGAYSGFRFVRFAEPGQSDLWGWERGTGRHIEVEVKRKGGRTDSKRAILQQQWLERCRRDGVIAFQASSVEEADAKLAEYGYPKRLIV